MATQHISPVPPALSHVQMIHDTDTQVFWLSAHSSAQQKARPCCTQALLEEAMMIQTYVDRVQQLQQQTLGESELSHLVISSEADAFCLGGDLAHFVRAIRARDRASLEEYALLCVDAIYGFQELSAGATHTIALIQGDALGGGFELALACDTIIAEEGTIFAFPEVHFGLFPGMGAYPLLCKRTSAQIARRMILDRRTYSAEELARAGIVDQIAPKHDGTEVVEQFIAQQRKSAAAVRTCSRIHHAKTKVSLEELQTITRSWVDCALQLPQKSINVMERLLGAQRRHFAPAASPTLALQQ